MVEYAPSKRNRPGDRLFVPTGALDQLSRYVGGEVPTPNKLGRADRAETEGRPVRRSGRSRPSWCSIASRSDDALPFGSDPARVKGQCIVAEFDEVRLGECRGDRVVMSRNMDQEFAVRNIFRS